MILSASEIIFNEIKQWFDEGDRSHTDCASGTHLYNAKVYKDWMMQQSYIHRIAKVYKDWMMEPKDSPISWQKSTKTGWYNTKICPFHGNTSTKTGWYNSFTHFMAKVYKDWVMQHKSIPNSWQKSTKTGWWYTKLHLFYGESLQRLGDRTQSYTHFKVKVYKDWMKQHKPIPISWQKSTKTG